MQSSDPRGLDSYVSFSHVEQPNDTKHAHLTPQKCLMLPVPRYGDLEVEGARGDEMRWDEITSPKATFDGSNGLFPRRAADYLADDEHVFQISRDRSSFLVLDQTVFVHTRRYARSRIPTFRSNAV